VDEAAAIAEDPPYRGPLLRAESFAYWLVVAPLLAALPASLAYRAACRRSDWVYRHWPESGAEIARNLRQVLGDDLSPEEAERMAREHFRSDSCEVIDVMLLRGRARSLRKLVEIRGREHLDAALAGGKGAIVCSAHYGSYLSAFSVLHASGYPTTTIGRMWWDYTPGVSSISRRFWNAVYRRRLIRHRQRPNIEPWPGQLMSAVQAAAVLSDNEVVTICSDAAPVSADLPRVVEVPFLGRQASLLPGVITLARLTDAPVLMTFMHRSADYRHQVLEISAPVPVQDDTTAAFRRCVAAMDAAISKNPAHWGSWAETGDLVCLGLVPGGLASRTVDVPSTA
jgi:lauroyl/myristoyl acyltransferase